MPPTLLALLGAAALAAAVRGRAAAEPTADVRVTASPNTAVFVIGAQAASGVRGAGTYVRGDTLFARTPLRFSAALAEREVRIEAAAGVPIRLEATLANAPASAFGASGHVLVLEAGGRGVRTVR
jgi:hypothetical protein